MTGGAIHSDPELVDVHLVGLPLGVLADAQERSDELMREFALIAHSGPEEHDRVPNRLLDLVTRTRNQYAPFTGPTTERIEDARAKGADAVDVTYRIPPEMAQVAQRLGAELDEADEFCRGGDLLALATPPRLVRFRRWFLEEFSRQIAGEPPIPWPDYDGN